MCYKTAGVDAWLCVQALRVGRPYRYGSVWYGSYCYTQEYTVSRLLFLHVQCPSSYASSIAPLPETTSSPPSPPRSLATDCVESDS